MTKRVAFVLGAPFMLTLGAKPPTLHHTAVRDGPLRVTYGQRTSKGLMFSLPVHVQALKGRRGPKASLRRRPRVRRQLIDRNCSGGCSHDIVALCLNSAELELCFA